MKYIVLLLGLISSLVAMDNYNPVQHPAPFVSFSGSFGSDISDVTTFDEQPPRPSTPVPWNQEKKSSPVPPRKNSFNRKRIILSAAVGIAALGMSAYFYTQNK